MRYSHKDIQLELVFIFLEFLGLRIDRYSSNNPHRCELFETVSEFSEILDPLGNILEGKINRKFIALADKLHNNRFYFSTDGDMDLIW